MKLLNKIKDKFNNIDKPGKFEIGLLIFFLVGCYLIFNQGDILITSTHGKDLLQLSLKGKFLSFYSYTESTAVYLIPLYILFAIWSIPVKIVYSLRGVNLWGKLDYFGMNYIDLMWYKLLPVVFCLLTCIVLKKILNELLMDERRKKWANYLFLSFPILVFSQFIFGQYDSFNMFFTTLGLYYFIKRKYYKFSIAFSLGITFKLFPLFIFIPLVLLVEKRVFHIAKYVIIGLLGTILSNLIFITDAGFKATKEFTGSMYERIFTSGINTQFGVISIFLVLFIAACVYAYLCKEKNKNKQDYISIYLCMAIYGAFYTFVFWHPQWVILLVPFWVISMLMSDNLKTSYILSIVMSAGYVLLSFLNWPCNVDETMINQGLLPVITGKRIYTCSGIKNIFSKSHIFNSNMFITLFAAAIILNIILKFPTTKKLDNYVNKKNTDMPEKGYMLCLLAIPLLYIVPAIIFYITA